MMVATKEDQTVQSELIAPNVLYTHPSQKDFCLALQSSMEGRPKKTGDLDCLTDAVFSPGNYILIDSPESLLLGCLDAHQFKQLQKLFDSAEGLLWVSFGGEGKGSNPTTGSVTGFLRSLRSENEGVPYVHLDLGPQSHTPRDTQMNVITRILRLRLDSKAHEEDSPDFEYRLYDGIIKIPRLVEDKDANGHVRPMSAERTELQPLRCKGVYRKLDMRQIGLLDSFYFGSQNLSDMEIADDEVEVCVKSAGLNFKDVLIASGTLPAPLNLGIECAGEITRVGSEALGLKVGDRVCAIGSSTLATHVRVSSRCTIKIPQSMDFAVAASIPTVFTTACYCLYVTTRLKFGEVILIHSATGGLGQACLKMAQAIGAKIIATCGSQEKVNFLRDTYGLPRGHILNSRSHRYTTEVMRITEGKGVDVLINDQAGDGLREGWACMARFGRFIDVAKRDSIENANLPMDQFAKGVAYLPVPLDLHMVHQPEAMTHALQKGVALVLGGEVSSIEPITAFKASEIEKAFRFMQSGKHIGKIVLNMETDDQVEVSVWCNARQRFRF